MAILNPPRPDFKRSSENTTEAERQEAHEVRRLSKLEAAGPRGFDWEDKCRERASHSFGLGSGAAATVCVTRRSITDESRYDLEGVVFP